MRCNNLVGANGWPIWPQQATPQLVPDGPTFVIPRDQVMLNASDRGNGEDNSSSSSSVNSLDTVGND